MVPAYEEAIHVPLIIHNPRLVPQNRSIDMLTSHVDILPTIPGLAGIDACKSMAALKNGYTETHPLVGRNLASLILNNEKINYADEPVYFMTDDDPSKTLSSLTPLTLSRTVEPVTQPNHIETVIVKLPTGRNYNLEIWKYSRYFDNPQFWSNPGFEDKNKKQGCTISKSENIDCNLCVTWVKTKPVTDELEMYNLTADPIESQNLTNPEFENAKSAAIQVVLAKLLAEQCQKKRLYPSNGNIHGKPFCKKFAPIF